MIGDFLAVVHPQAHDCTMLDLMADMGPLYQRLVPDLIPYDVYPAERGMVLWANTSEGDACFLIPHSDGTWKIGVWFRQWVQWEEYDDSVPSWLVSQVTGELIIPGLPLQGYGDFVPED